MNSPEPENLDLYYKQEEWSAEMTVQENQVETIQWCNRISIKKWTVKTQLSGREKKKISMLLLILIEALQDIVK